jgi:hypothetical protein
VLGLELLRSGGNIFSTPQAGAAEVKMPVTPDEALAELMAGNKRFINSYKRKLCGKDPLPPY